MKSIYAIRDRVANDLAGYFPLVVFNTSQQAIRYFADSATTEKSALGAHLTDYELIFLGEIADEGNIRAVEPVVVITGDALKAALTSQQSTQPNA